MTSLVLRAIPSVSNEKAHRRSAGLGKQFVIFCVSAYPNPKKPSFNGVLLM
jgi:hypothetical protein